MILQVEVLQAVLTTLAVCFIINRCNVVFYSRLLFLLRYGFKSRQLVLAGDIIFMYNTIALFTGSFVVMSQREMMVLCNFFYSSWWNKGNEGKLISYFY